jgi:large subunit ribosomal protein L6
MKNIIIPKQDKKIKIFISDQNITDYLVNKILTIKGPLGELQYTFKNQYPNTKLFIQTKSFDFFIKKIKKLLKSVTNGWFLELNLNGIGFKSFKLQDKIALDLGYSNLVIYKPTAEIKIKNLKNKIVLFSIKEEYLKDVANKLRNYAFPDSYKGKGILFKNEIIKLKKKAKS